MAGKQVFRIKPRQRLQWGLVNHIVGLTRPEYARDIDERVKKFAGSPLAAFVAVQLFRQMKRGRGRLGYECVELVFAGPPQTDTEGEWGRELVLAWVAEVYEWAKEKLGPESIIAAAALHWDETSPHVHILFVPIKDGRVGWRRVRDDATYRLTRRTNVHYRKQTSLWQDDLHEKVNTKYGLERGEKGSQATHQAIDRQKGSETMKRNAEAKAERERKKAEEERLKAEREKAKADEAAADRVASQKVVAENEDRVRVLEGEAEAKKKEKEDSETAAEQARVQRQTEEQAGGILRGLGKARIKRVENERDEALRTVTRLTTENGQLKVKLTEKTDEVHATNVSHEEDLEEMKREFGVETTALTEKVSTLETECDRLTKSCNVWQGTAKNNAMQLEEAKAKIAGAERLGWERGIMRFERIVLAEALLPTKWFEAVRRVFSRVTKALFPEAEPQPDSSKAPQQRKSGRER